jgi:hypothetical protein
VIWNTKGARKTHKEGKHKNIKYLCQEGKHTEEKHEEKKKNRKLEGSKRD